MSITKTIAPALFGISSVLLINTIPAANASSIPKTVAPTYAQGEVLVKFKSNGADRRSFPKSTILGQTITSGFYRTKEYSLLDVTVIKSDVHSTEELIGMLEDNEDIDAVTPNYIYTLSATSDPYYNMLWGIENTGAFINYTRGTPDADMDVNEAWKTETGDSSVIVAVLDTGIDYTHPDLAGNMWSGMPNHGYDFAADAEGNNDNDPMPAPGPFHWHGTHVAGTIGAVGDNGVGISGVAQNVSLMALKVFRPNLYAYENDILEAIEFILRRIDEGENIVAVNASFGGSRFSPLMQEAIRKLGSKGVVFCAAAGNEQNNNDRSPSYPASYDLGNIISIAASDQRDELANFSNFGVTSVDIAAPGVNIYSTSTGNSYRFASGTSMAAPHVAGAIALLASRYPNTTAVQRKNLLLAYADRKEGLLGKTATGSRANIQTALSANPLALKAVDDYAITRFETRVTIDALSNDIARDIRSLKTSLVSLPSNGRVYKANGKFVYTPGRGFSGNDSFSYMISDGRSSSVASVSVLINEKPIHIPDEKFAACVKRKTGVADVLDITKSRVSKITNFRCEERFASMAGIEHFSNLKTLNLTSRNLSDLSPLKNLTKLTSLSVGGYDGNGNIRDISPLSSLENLTYLSIYSTRVSDISALGGLRRLQTLKIDDNQISDISILENLVNLRILSMSNNRISNIVPLRMMRNLYRLEARNNIIRDISAIGRIFKPVFIDLQGNKISQLSSLKAMNNVWSLNLAENDISDISPLRKIAKIRFLILDRNRICDFSPVSHAYRVYGRGNQYTTGCSS